jgi:MATE family multidrug resistance protein
VARDVRALCVIGWPLILNNLFNIGVNVADTLMIGRLGSTQLAALSIGSGVWIGVFLAGLGVIMALGPTVAQHYGAGRHAEIGHDMRQAIWLALAMSVLVITVMHHVEPVLAWIGIQPEVSEIARGYLHALSFGVPGVYLYHVMRQMNEGIGRTVPIMIVMGISLAINVALNFGFVFGHFGLPPLGTVGSGVGSAMTFWCMFAMIAIHMRRSPHYARFVLWTGLEKPDRHALARLVGLGGPIGLSLMLQAGLFTTLALLMGSLGKQFGAAHQITLNYAGLVFMIPLGLAMATTVCVGQAIGRDDPRHARRLGVTGIAVCGSIASTVAALTWWFAPKIAGLYTHDATVVPLATSLLAVSAVLQVGDGTQTAAAGALRGMKDTRVPLLINACIYWGVGFSVAWVLGFRQGAGAIGIWTGLASALCTAAVALSLRFMWVARRRIVDAPRELSRKPDLVHD